MNRSLLVLMLAGAASCGSFSRNQPPRTAAAESLGPDGGTPVPPPSHKKGIIVPGAPMGAGSNGTSPGPALGNAPGAN